MAARIQRRANDSRARAIRLKLDAASLPDGQFLSALDLGGMGDTLAREGRDQNAFDRFHRSSRVRRGGRSCFEPLAVVVVSCRRFAWCRLYQRCCVPNERLAVDARGASRESCGAGPRRRRALLLALVELVDGAGLDAGGDGDALPHVAVARDLTREQIGPLDMSQYSMFP